MSGSHLNNYTQQPPQPPNPGPPPFSFTYTPPNGESSRSEYRTQREVDADAAEADAKRRKVQRACDVCRRKKIRCEGPMNSNSTSKCANCQEYGLDCTYVEMAKRRGPPKGYIDTLEQRCKRLEAVVLQLRPGFDLTAIVGPQPDKEDFDTPAYNETLRSLGIPPFPGLKPLPPSLSSANSPHHSSPAAHPSPSRQLLGQSPWRTFEKDPSRQVTSPDRDLDEANMHVHIAQTMSRLDIKDSQWRFHGKASPHHLFMKMDEIKGAGTSDQMRLLDTVKQSRRKEYWQIPEWESALASEGLRPLDYSVWPEEDLAKKLIHAYFEHVNLHTPLLNRLIFQKQYDAQSYRSSHEFAKVCLLVFANGAGYIDDERIYWPEYGPKGKDKSTKDETKHSAGWIYLRAVIRMGRSMMQSPNLLDFQMQILICLFLNGSAAPHLTWIISGLGIRAAQEIGIHMRSILLHADPIERALYNRAFWCLYHIDRMNCATIGRSVAIQDTDFDADYPLMVDDEYWDTGDPGCNFIQPPEIESKVSAFVLTLKLDHIIGAALRTIYALNTEHRSDPASRRSTVVELESALNSWADAVPDSLRWDPSRADQRLFDQSAGLYVHYYFCQILVHRLFIPTPKHPETIGLPSLAICSNAARSIANIVDASLRRGKRNHAKPGHTLAFHFLIPTWMAATILLIAAYSSKSSNPTEKERNIKDIKKCIAACREIETIWRQAGKFTDFMVVILADLENPQSQDGGGGGENQGADGDGVAGDWRRSDASSIHRICNPSSMPGSLFSAPESTISLPDTMTSGQVNQTTDDMVGPVYNTFTDLSGIEMPSLDDGMDEFWAQLLGGYAPAADWTFDQGGF